MADRADPSGSPFAVAPSDSTIVESRFLYVGTGGNLYVDGVDSGVNVPYLNVPSGTFLPIRTKKVYSTGLTASNIVGHK